MTKYFNILFLLLIISIESNAEKIRIHIENSLGANYAGFIVADSLGYYQQHGISIEFCNDWGFKECPEDTIITVAVMNLDKAVEYACNGGDIVNICQINQTSSLAFFSLKSRKSIENITDIAQMKVAVQKGMYRDTSYLNRLLGIDVRVFETHAAMEMLVLGAVDIILGSMEREYIDLYFSGFDHDELSIVKLNDIGLDIVEEGLYTSNEDLRAKTELFKKFINATIEGWKYAKRETEKAALIIVDYLKQHKMKANYEIVDEELEHVLLHVFPEDKEHIPFELDKKEYDKVIKFLLNAGIIENKVNYHQFYKKEF